MVSNAESAFNVEHYLANAGPGRNSSRLKRVNSFFLREMLQMASFTCTGAV